MSRIAERVRASVKSLFVFSGDASPEWDEAAYRYAIWYCRRQAWRVRREMDLDDLLQEAYVLFVSIRSRYPDVSEDNFLALWRSALHNRIVNIGGTRGAKCRRQTEPLESDPLIEEDEIEWRLHVQDAPPEVRQLLDAVERRRWRLPRRNHADGRRETTNAYLCRLARLPAGTPLRGMFEKWLEDFRRG
ncbi:MAG: hypothetical protein WC378_00200 [Opitutaceae bacterium]|jgi:hypothetical protein